MPDLRQALKDFVATSNSGKYKSEDELMSKFPELSGYDRQALKDFVATSNSGKYKTEDELLSKFPEFKLGKSKDTPKGTGVSNSQQPSNSPKTKSGSQSTKASSDGAAYDELAKKYNFTEPAPEVIEEAKSKVIKQKPPTVKEGGLTYVDPVRKSIENKSKVERQLRYGFMTPDQLAEEYKDDPDAQAMIAEFKNEEENIRTTEAFQGRYLDKSSIENVVGQDGVVTDSDNFLETYFGKENLKKYGVDPKDFDGFLNDKLLKEGLKEQLSALESKGGEFAGNNPKLTQELAKVNLISKYITQKNLDKERLLSFYRTKIKEGDQTYKEKYNNLLGEINQSKIAVKSLINEQFPEYTKAVEDRNNKISEEYYKYKKGEGDEFKNFFSTAGEGLVGSMEGLFATAMDVAGDSETATKIRLAKSTREFQNPLKDLYYGYEEGYKVEHNGVNYLVTPDGKVLDIDDKLNATDVITDSDYQTITEKAKQVKEKTSSTSIGGMTQMGAGVVADLAVQVALTKGVGATRGAISKGAGALRSRVATSETVAALERSLYRTSLGREIYSRGMAKALVPEESLLGSAAAKVKGIPAVYADTFIAQSAYGYSHGYNQVMTEMMREGYSEDEAKKVAEAGANQMALLYGATAFINPRVKLLDALDNKTTDQLIKESIAAYKREGGEKFLETLVNGTKGLISKNSARNVKDVLGEGTKEAVQENVQQIGETEVNENLNDIIGEDLLNETYTYKDFVNTTALSFGAGMMMNSPLLVRGSDKLDILRDLSRDSDKFSKSLDYYVDQGFATREQADRLKSEVEIYSKYENKIPKEVDKNAVWEVMTRLDKIDKLEVEKKNAHDVFKDSFNQGIDKNKAEIDELIKTGTNTFQDAKNIFPEDSRGKTDDNTTKGGQEGAVSGETTQTEGVQEVEPKPLSELINTEVTLKPGVGNALTKATKGTLILEGNKVVFESGNTKHDLGDVNEIGNKPATEFNVDYQLEEVIVNDNGQIVIKEGVFNIQEDLPSRGIEYNKDGSVKAVSLKTDEGKTIMIEGKKAEDIAYQIKLKPVDFKPSNKPVNTNEPITEVETINQPTSTQQVEEPTTDQGGANTSEPGNVEGTEADEEVVKRKIADTIRKAKFYKTPSERMSKLRTDASQPFIFAWDMAVETVAQSVELTGNLAKAINQGVKAIKETEWYKGLSSEGKKEAESLFRSEAEVNLRPLADAVVKSKKTTKQTIRENTGQVDTSKKVETTESKLNKLYFKAQQTQSRIQTAFTKKNRVEAVSAAKILLDDLYRKGIATKGQFKNLTKAALNLDPNNEKAVKAYMDRLGKVVEKINTKALMNEVQRAARKARKVPKNMPANIQTIGKLAGSLDYRYLSKESLDKYLAMLNDIDAASKTLYSQAKDPKVIENAKQKMVDVKASERLIEKLQEEIDEAQLLEFREDLESQGFDTTDMSDSDLQEFWETTHDSESSEEVDKRAAVIREKLVTIAKDTKSRVLGSMTPKTDLEKAMHKSLKNVNLDFMSPTALKDYIRVLQNIEVNENYSNAGSIVAYIDSMNNLVEFTKRLIASGVPLGSVGVDIKVKQLSVLGDLKSMAILYKAVFRTPKMMGDFHHYSGLSNLSKSSAKSDMEYKTFREKFDKLYENLAKKNKKFTNAKSTYLRGMASILIQGSTPQEFELNKQKLEKHIENTKFTKKPTRFSKEVEVLEEVYKPLKGLNSQQEVMDYLKSLNDGNYDAIKFFLDEFKEIKPRLKENTEVVHNEIFKEISENYLPTRVSKLTAQELSKEEIKQNTVTKAKKAGNTISRNNKKLGDNELLDLDFENVMLTTMKNDLNDINVSQAFNTVVSFFKNPVLAKAIGKANVNGFVSRLKHMQEMDTSANVDKESYAKAANRIERIFRKISVTADLGGVTAIFKQTIPVMVGASVQNPHFMKDVFKFIGKANVENKLMSNYSIHFRGDTQGGTATSADRIDDINKFNGAAGAVSKTAEKLGEKADKVREIWMTPLSKGDSLVAKATWVSYYLEYLRSEGINTDEINDLDEEGELLMEDEVRQRAAAYAEVRVEETQVATDSKRLAPSFSKTHLVSVLIRSIFLPYQQFNVNAKLRFLEDIDAFAKSFSKSKGQNYSGDQIIEMLLDPKRVDMLNEWANKEGKNSTRARALRSIAATALEVASFYGIKMALGATVAVGLKSLIADFFGVDDEEKETNWAFKLKQFYSGVVKDLNPYAVGSFLENGYIDALNKLSFWLDEDYEDFTSYEEWEKYRNREEGGLPFYRYKEKPGESGNTGIYGSAMGVFGNVKEMADIAWDGQRYYYDEYGNYKVLEIKGDELDFMRTMLLLEIARGTVGFEADTYRAADKVKREIIKANSYSAE